MKNENFRLIGFNFSYDLVNISCPSFVISIVCSTWALREPSTENAVHPSSWISTSSLPNEITGSMVKTIPHCIDPLSQLSKYKTEASFLRLKHLLCAKLTVMQNLRRSMKVTSNSMTNKCRNYSKTTLSSCAIDFIAYCIEFDSWRTFSDGLERTWKRLWITNGLRYKYQLYLLRYINSCSLHQSETGFVHQ